MVSIIVPFYNSRRYLDRTINSILCQTFKDIELLLVNDGSTDDSLIVCKKFLEKDRRIVLIDKQNEGVDKSRFLGLKMAQGEYITFVDADDWLEPNALSSMLELMKQDDYDFVEVSSFKCLGPIRQKRSLPVSGCLEVPELFDKYYISFFGWNILPVSIWGKLFRREVLDEAGLSPSGFLMGEDLIFNMRLFPYLKKVYLLDKPLYNYRYGGMTSGYNPFLLPDLKSQFLLKLQAIEDYSYHRADDLARIEMVNVLHSDIKQRLIYQDKQSREKIVEDIRDEIDEDFWCEVLNITNGYFDNSPFYIALMNRDAESLYAICKKEVDSTRIQRACKRVASRILSII